MRGKFALNDVPFASAAGLADWMTLQVLRQRIDQGAESWEPPGHVCFLNSQA